jgi:hypothetical protein
MSLTYDLISVQNNQRYLNKLDKVLKTLLECGFIAAEVVLE